jgi:AraC-like DNA-binding protein
MQAAAAHIRDHLRTPLSVARLAREFGCSVSHFSRTFAAVTGTRPQAFVIDARIERARELLTTTSLPIGAIAAEVGMADLFYFSRLFKRSLGIAPSEFRRQALASGG